MFYFQEVELLKLEIIKEKPNLSVFLNNRVDHRILEKVLLKPMEERRNKLKAAKLNHAIKKLEKSVNRRGRKVGYVVEKKTPWPEIELREFFLPGRYPSVKYNVPCK